MTKQEIYEQVVRLTRELAETGIVEKIFDATALYDPDRIDTIFEAFPDFYPELYDEIVEFGWKYNALVGDSAEDNLELAKLWQEGASLMYVLAETNIISDLSDAEETGDPDEVMDTIVDYKEKNLLSIRRLLDFQKKYNDVRNNAGTGTEGAIFGPETDVGNGMFVFDTNVIDALSFYIFTILAGVKDTYFFYNECGDEGYYGYPDKNYITALALGASGYFAEFVSSYNIDDWVGEHKEYQSIGELFVDIYTEPEEE